MEIDMLCNGRIMAQREELGQPVQKKRLRAQQRQLISLSQEVEVKRKEFEKLDAQHTYLLQRLKVLEAVLPVREQQLCHMEQEQQQHKLQLQEAIASQWRPVNQCEVHEVSTGGGTSSSSGASTGDKQLTPGEGVADSGTPDLASSDPLDDKRTIALLLAPLQRRDEAADWPMSARGSPGLPECYGAPEHVMRKAMAAWRQWVGVAALQLHLHDARPDDVGPKLLINQAHDQVLAYARSLRVRYPNMMHDLLRRNVETGERVTLLPEGFWLPVARGMRLGAAQVADIRAALHLYQERMDRVLAERRVISGQLSGVLSQLVQRGVGHAYQVERMQLLVRAEELQQQLSRNVAMEGQCAGIIKDFMGSGVFTQVQTARASVLAYPYFLDAVALMHAVVQQHEDDSKAAHAGPTMAAGRLLQ